MAVIWGDLGVVEVVIWRHLVVIWGGVGVVIWGSLFVIWGDLGVI